mgnify:CR=1 FL=1
MRNMVELKGPILKQQISYRSSEAFLIDFLAVPASHSNIYICSYNIQDPGICPHFAHYMFTLSP